MFGQPEKITAVFPMRFKENSDVIIATAFFQVLTRLESRDISQFLMWETTIFFSFQFFIAGTHGCGKLR